MADGLRKGLTSYGDAGFSLFLRKAFIKAMGYSDDALEPPDRRHHQHLQRLQSLPRQCPADHRGGETRRDAGRRDADGVSDHLDRREFCASDLDVSAQSDGDGYRGDDPRPADGRGGRDRRLRQDLAGADHGRRIRRSADRRHSGRADGGRASQGRGAGRLHRLPAALGQIPRRRDRRRRDRSRQRPSRAVGRHLHGDGHRDHHGLHHRGARPVAADERDHPGAPCRAVSLGRGERQGRRRDGEGQGTAAQRVADRVIVPQCAGGAAGDRRLDQRPDPSDRDRQPDEASDRSRRLSTSSAARCRC